MDSIKRSKTRKVLAHLLWPVVPIVIVGGLKYPFLGLTVPVVMLMGVIGGIFRGRYVCGWLCPRGAFFDRIMGLISPKKEIPPLFRNYILRWAIFILLMGLVAFQITRVPTDINHLGKVFVRICIITTSAGILLAIIYHPRAWCSLCPMGTLQSVVGGQKLPLYMEDGCRECRICEASCPIGLKIVGNIKDGKLDSKDCLKCPECALSCPKNILHF
jgi:ferredoxin-type protein NapH